MTYSLSLDIIPTLLCQTQPFMVYISTSHLIEGKNIVNEIFLLSLLLSLSVVPEFCHINSKKKPYYKHWALWVHKRHKFEYFVPKQIIFLFHFFERKGFGECMWNILSLLTLICINFVYVKYFISWKLLPKQYITSSLKAWTVWSTCIAECSALKFPLKTQ